MPKLNKGRLMGAKFKTYSGAAKRAASERIFERGKGYTFRIEDEIDPVNRANGYRFRIRKTKESTNA